jgi:hypothetical protein
MRSTELSRPISGAPERLDERSILRVLHDPVVAVRVVAVGDEDIAVRGGNDVARRGEMRGVISCDACLAERQQNLALRGKLEDLMADPLACGLRLLRYCAEEDQVSEVLLHDLTAASAHPSIRSSRPR